MMSLVKCAPSLCFLATTTTSPVSMRGHLRHLPNVWLPRASGIGRYPCRTYATDSRRQPAKASDVEAANLENLALGHSKFIAEAQQTDDWPDDKAASNSIKPADDPTQSIRRGRLLPTSSHLFKLVLPLPGLRPISKPGAPPVEPEPVPPTVFLLHPSQPLSHIARLIQASLPSPTHGPQAFTPRLPTVSFQHEELDKGKQQWSDSTDIGDFVKEAAHSKEFTILITPDQATNTAQLAPQDGSPGAVHDRKEPDAYAALQIPVSVPSYEDRTRYLRRRLDRMDGELNGMQDIKDSCDALARRGTKRIATGVFVVLLTYWLAVLRLTFFSTYGWETMEPVTYLTEFMFILGGYVWFLRQGREVSYSSILNQSLSARRRALYTSHGLDIERWADLVTEEKAIKREIERIREDYEGGWKPQEKTSSGADAAKVEKALAEADERPLLDGEDEKAKEHKAVEEMRDGVVKDETKALKDEKIISG